MEIKQIDYDFVANQIQKIKTLFCQYANSQFEDEEQKINYVNERISKLKTYINKNNTRIYVAMLQHNIIGLLWIFIREKRTLHINSIIVDSNYKGCGIGTRFLQELEKIKASLNLLSIDLIVSANNCEAIQFYNRNGFTVKSYIMEK